MGCLVLLETESPGDDQVARGWPRYHGNSQSSFCGRHLRPSYMHVGGPGDPEKCNPDSLGAFRQLAKTPLFLPRRRQDLHLPSISTPQSWTRSWVKGTQWRVYQFGVPRRDPPAE